MNSSCQSFFHIPLLKWVLLAAFLGDLSYLHLYLYGWNVKYTYVLLVKVVEIIRLGKL